jgi:hypothetical protein
VPDALQVAASAVVAGLVCGGDVNGETPEQRIGDVIGWYVVVAGPDTVGAGHGCRLSSAVVGHGGRRPTRRSLLDGVDDDHSDRR